MSAARNPDQSDFDLERFINMFDEALTSRDPRVIDALRGLMMTVTLTCSETRDVMEDRRTGPLRRLVEDVNDLHRRIARLEEILSGQVAKKAQEQYDYERSYKSDYTMYIEFLANKCPTVGQPEHLLKMLNSDTKGLR
jgi:hypothetical protein